MGWELASKEGMKKKGEGTRDRALTRKNSVHTFP